MQQYKNLFFYLLLLTLFFIFLEISFFFQCNSQYFTDMREASDNFRIPIGVLPGAIYFLAVQLLVHFFFTIIVWLLTIEIASCLKLDATQTFYAGISCWLLGLMTVLTANAYYFPGSTFSELWMTFLFNRTVVKVLLGLLVGLCACLMILPVIARPLAAFAMTAAIVFLALNHSQPSRIILSSPATTTHPNIILVGIDSLRPDFLGFFGRDNHTPFLDAFLSQSTVFGEATTPLARTYPSWTVILTGLYPRQSGVRFNLPKQLQVVSKHTLPTLLKERGYHAIYATDEVRFSNIDQTFGFTEVISPPVGLNDFLLGSLNDFPISNLLINTPIGNLLFPHSYANRPVHFTYNPNSFLNTLKPVLSRQQKAPVFLAIHFCLPHYPYLWAGISASHMSPQARYQASVRRVDKQVRDFFALLQENHFLDHAVVVVLSDHGEALEFLGDRITEEELFQSYPLRHAPAFYPASLDNEKMNQSAGHGTDVLGLSQYHALLAFKFYGLTPQAIGVRSGRVSLLDIRPTLLSLLGIDQPSVGKSLLSNIQLDKNVNSSHRHLFMESDFSPAAIRTVYPDAHKVLLEGIGLFQINPHNLHLQVKDEMGEKILMTKQYADLYGEWMLALYPQPQGGRMPILVNLRTGQWTNDLHSRLAFSAPAGAMMRALKTFYAGEL